MTTRQTRQRSIVLKGPLGPIQIPAPPDLSAVFGRRALAAEGKRYLPSEASASLTVMAEVMDAEIFEFTPPAGAFAGEVLDFWARVRNTGNTPIEEQTVVTDVDTGHLYYESTWARLSLIASHGHHIYIDMPNRNLNIRCDTYIREELGAPEELADTKSATIALAVRDIDIVTFDYPAEAAEGESFTIYVGTQNVGNVEVESKIRLTDVDTGDILSEPGWGGHPVGLTRTYDIPVTMPNRDLNLHLECLMRESAEAPEELADERFGTVELGVPPPPPPPPEVPTELTINLDPESVMPGEEVTVWGQLSTGELEDLTGMPIEIYINDTFLIEVTTNQVGNYATSITAPETAGSYTITAKFPGYEQLAESLARGVLAVGAVETFMVKGEAFSFPAPPGRVEAQVTVNASKLTTPFEEKIPAGTRVFTAEYNEQTLKETLTVDRDLTVVFLFDPMGLLSRIVLVPTMPLPTPPPSLPI